MNLRKKKKKKKKKKRKIGKGNLHLTENRLSCNEMCCAADKAKKKICLFALHDRP